MTRMMRCIVNGVEEMRPVERVEWIECTTFDSSGEGWVEGFCYPILLEEELLISIRLEGDGFVATISAPREPLLSGEYIATWREEYRKKKERNRNG